MPFNAAFDNPVRGGSTITVSTIASTLASSLVEVVARNDSTLRRTTRTTRGHAAAFISRSAPLVESPSTSVTGPTPHDATERPSSPPPAYKSTTGPRDTLATTS